MAEADLAVARFCVFSADGKVTECGVVAEGGLAAARFCGPAAIVGWAALRCVFAALVGECTHGPSSSDSSVSGGMPAYSRSKSGADVEGLRFGADGKVVELGVAAETTLGASGARALVA